MKVIHGIADVRVGDTYIATCGLLTRAIDPKTGEQAILNPGDRLYVLEPTGYTPAVNCDEMGPKGHNWVCVTHYGATIWSSLESCIDRGLFKKVS